MAAVVSRSKHSNLQCFLNRTTPSVLCQSSPKTCAGDSNYSWQLVGKDTAECFNLGDLWDSYYEWSAYGAGTPIRLDSGETVVQYYVPYLSAIQIYTCKPLAPPRNAGEDSETDSWSDDSESERLSRSWDAVSDDSGLDQEGLWPTKDRIGHLYLQFVETCAPYARVPLMDKVIELARRYPGLMSFKSSDLSPASWMAVAWYPIYHIPTRSNVKDLCTCFVTYHTISSCFQENISGDFVKDEICAAPGKDEKKPDGARNCISLPAFGLATYKMQGNIWMNPETADNERVVALFNAADSWLKQLRVRHHDFNYFYSHSM